MSNGRPLRNRVARAIMGNSAFIAERRLRAAEKATRQNKTVNKVAVHEVKNGWIKKLWKWLCSLVSR